MICVQNIIRATICIYKLICYRWQAWEKFGREVSEMPVMFSDDGILKDFMPGIVFLADIIF